MSSALPQHYATATQPHDGTPYTTTVARRDSREGRPTARKYKRDANVPGEKPMHPIQLEWAEPGVKMGQ